MTTPPRPARRRTRRSPRRTLRRHGVILAAILALIAAVLAAPTATASPIVPVDVSMPGYVANDGSTATTITLTADNTADGQHTLDDTSAVLRISVSDDRFDCLAPGAIELTAVSQTNLSVDLDSARYGRDGHSSCSYTMEIDSGNTFSGDGHPDDTLPVGTKATATYTLTIDGTHVSPRVNGTVEVSFELDGAIYVLGHSTATANLVTLHAPTLSTDRPPHPAPGLHYSHRVTLDPGGPGVRKAISDYSDDDARGYYLIGVPSLTSGPNAGKYDYDHIRYIDASSANYDAGYHALVFTDNAANTSSTFAFYPRTGVIALAPGVPASDVNFLSGRDYTWVVVARNGQGGAAAGSPIPGLSGADGVGTPPTLHAHDVASAPLSLQIHFTDYTPGDGFGTEVYTLARNNIIQGYPTGKFRPRRSVNRQAFAAYLVRTYNTKFGGNAPTGKCSGTGPFPDVSAGHAFCQEITWLADHHITAGYPDGGFHPSAPITRQAIAAFFYRFGQFISHGAVPDSDPSCDASAFADVATSSPFCGDIGWMASTSPTITRGYGGDQFRPTRQTSRQAAAAFFYRFVQVQGASW